MQYSAVVLFLAASAQARVMPSVRQEAPAGPQGFQVTSNVEAPQARIIPVEVGGQALTFTPNNVQANPGDILQFQFNAQNHSVVQSDEATPCQPLQGGLNSGFLAFDAASAVVNTFTVQVADANPMFLYCSQGEHCQGGMVMAVNA